MHEQGRFDDDVERERERGHALKMKRKGKRLYKPRVLNGAMASLATLADVELFFKSTLSFLKKKTINSSLNGFITDHPNSKLLYTIY